MGMRQGNFARGQSMNLESAAESIPAFLALPTSLQTVRTRPLFVARLEVKPYQVLDGTPGGFRRVGVVPGGSFVGDRLSGTVAEGGNDWQFVRSDRAVTLDVRLVLKTTDGALIGMSYKGLRHGPSDVIARVDRGEDVDPGAYYFRTNPMFETSARSYDWMNRVLAVGVGYRRSQDVLYSVFEVL
jgi:hypothetical protein